MCCHKLMDKNMCIWFQVVISADVEPKDLVKKGEEDEEDDSHRVLMDDLMILKNSVCRFCCVLYNRNNMRNFLSCCF